MDKKVKKKTTYGILLSSTGALFTLFVVGFALFDIVYLLLLGCLISATGLIFLWQANNSK
jgi:hypothetical protein